MKLLIIIKGLYLMIYQLPPAKRMFHHHLLSEMHLPNSNQWMIVELKIQNHRLPKNLGIKIQSGKIMTQMFTG